MYPVLELFHLLVFLVQSVVLHFSVLTFQCQFLETAELVFLQLVSHSLAVFHKLAAEAAAWAKDTMGLTLYEWLQELYVKYGFYRESLVSVVRKGKEGAEEIQRMMVDFRENPPKELAGSEVLTVRDYKSLEEINLRSGVRTPIDQDSSNVLQWITADGSIISVRPSGTEPKIKFYFGVKEPLPAVEQYDEVLAALDAKIEQIKADLKL